MITNSKCVYAMAKFLSDVGGNISSNCQVRREASRTLSMKFQNSERGLCKMYLFLLVFLALVSQCSGNKHKTFVQCEKCDKSHCPELHYCEGKAIKDHCGCCTICSSSRFQPHVVIAKPVGGNACEQVKCPKFKVCVENIQRVPLCTCPSEFVCRRNKKKKKREVCGTDDKTYATRCHMRIASCNQGVAVKKKYRGPCSTEDEEKDSVKYNRRLKRLKRRRRQRRRKDNETDEEKPNKRKKHKRRRRRKSGSKNGKGKSRRRRHKYVQRDDDNSRRAFEEAFSSYTWRA